MQQLPRYIAMMLLVLAMSANAQTSNSGRLSAWLQETIRQGNRQASSSSTAKSGRRAEVASMLTTVFVQMNDSLDDKTLAQYGCKKYAQLGDVAIVTMPLDNVDSLSKHPEVLRVEANDKARITMDTVPGITNLLPLYEQTASHLPYTGQGVMMGLMDVGFDLT